MLAVVAVRGVRNPPSRSSGLTVVGLARHICRESPVIVIIVYN